VECYDINRNKPFCYINGDGTGQCQEEVQTFILNAHSFYYQYFMEFSTYKNAEKICNKYNGTLAIITSMLENGAAFATLDLKNDDDFEITFFGYNECRSPEAVEVGEKKKWQFDPTYSSSTFTYWAEGEPNDFCGNEEECGAYLQSASDYRWYDVSCGSEVNFICSMFGEDYEAHQTNALHCEEKEFEWESCFQYEIILSTFVLLVIALTAECVGCGCFLSSGHLADAQDIEPLYCCGWKKLPYTRAFIIWLVLYTLLQTFTIISSTFWCWDFFCLFPNLVRILGICFYAYAFNSICSENSRKAARVKVLIVIEAVLYLLSSLLQSFTYDDEVIGIINLIWVLCIYPPWYYFWKKMTQNFAEREGWAQHGTINMPSGTTNLQTSGS